MTQDAAIRRRPVQARSRERFDQVLAAAAALIGERGVGDLTMTDIAVEAGMALTAVYRYFPNKQSVLRELALQTFARDSLDLLSTEVDVDADADALIASCIEEFWRRHTTEPYRLHLRAAIRADPELSALDLAESRANARAIAVALARPTGRTDLDVLEGQALLVVELIDSLMNLADRVEPGEGRTLVEDFTAMAVQLLVTPPSRGAASPPSPSP